MSDFIVTTKLDVARRQLETAIYFFFLDEDPVSMHTLTAASNEVLQGLAKHYYGKSVADEWLEVIKPDKVNEVRRMVKSPQNYFKHADSDPEGNFRFYYKATSMLIFQAIETYSKLAKTLPPIMMVFRVWFYLNDPKIILEYDKRQEFEKMAVNINCNDKKQFLELVSIFERKLNQLRITR